MDFIVENTYCQVCVANKAEATRCYGPLSYKTYLLISSCNDVWIDLPSVQLPQRSVEPRLPNRQREHRACFNVYQWIQQQGYNFYRDEESKSARSATATQNNEAVLGILLTEDSSNSLFEQPENPKIHIYIFIKYLENVLYPLSNFH